MLDPIDSEIGARIRQRRHSREVSQEQLGGALGLSARQIQKYEQGANRIAASTLVRVAAVLGCTVGWLVGEQAPDTSDALTEELLKAFDQLGSDERRRGLVNAARAMALSA